MTTGRFFWIDAFAPKAFTGNPAVVGVLDEWPDDAAMLAAASEFNLSETVFVRGRDGQYDIRWFTPTRELALVGHATLAAAHALMTVVEPSRDMVMFNSHLSGKLPARREGDGFSITLPADETQECDAPEGLLGGLGLDRVEARVGRHYMAILPSAAALRAIRPDFQALETLDRPTIVVTAPDDEADYALRFFAPANGVPEDAVSGVAQCSLMPYWARRLGRPDLVSRQLSARGGIMRCRLDGPGVVVSGPCRTIAQGSLDLG